MLPVAVLDSSVLVPVWSRVVLQRLAEPPSRAYSPVWSEWIIAETWRVLAWRWRMRAGRTTAAEWRAVTVAANRMLRRLLSVMTFVSLRDYAGPLPWPGLTDENDIPIWQTATLSQAQYVVSHNVADFPPLVEGRHLYDGIEYVTAIEFVEQVLGMDAEEIYDGRLPRGALVRSRRSF